MEKPLIQLALDSLDFDKTVALAKQAAPYVDVIEVGTPCIKHNGIVIVKVLKQQFPNKLLLVDLKTMDAGEYEAAPFYEAGADICTVLGTSGLATIQGVIKAANKFGGEVQVDLINVPDKTQCARDAVKLGAHIIGVHTGIDAQAAGQTPFADLQTIASLELKARISVAGGINANTINQAVKSGAHIVVVGGAITGASSPADAALEIRRMADMVDSHHQMIISKISAILAATDDSYEAKLTAMLDRAKRIFVSGAGRSGLIGRFFAMRLMHSGYKTFVVGEIVTPSIQRGDLLLIISGSGETEQLIAFTKRAKEVGATVALISAKSESTIGDMADAVFRIGSPEQYGKIKGMPMGTVFELSALSFLEALISHVIHEKGIPEEEMRTRHANLE